MNIKQLLEKFEKLQLNEMGIHISDLPFPEFRELSLQRRDHISARQNLANKIGKEEALKQYPKLEYENVLNAKEYQNILVTEESISHVKRDHPELGEQDWLEFLDTFNPKQDIQIPSRQCGFTGRKHIYKCHNDNNYFGYILRVYPSAEAQLVTMFKGHENSVDNWINNQIKHNQKGS